MNANNNESFAYVVLIGKRTSALDMGLQSMICTWSCSRLDDAIAATKLSSAGDVAFDIPTFGWLDRHKDAPFTPFSHVRQGMRPSERKLMASRSTYRIERESIPKTELHM